MDLAVTLIKSVLRAFYTTRDILVIDALILHETLRDDDLSYLMVMNTKDLHKVCGKLREDRFLAVHTRSELREGNPRPSNRTWYYINYRNTIDAIKWRLYTIDKEVQGNTIPASEKKEYFCSFCKSEWTMMEVLDNSGPDGFLCHRCQHTLTYGGDRNAGGHEQSTRLNDQFKFITELLPKIDASYIPETDFERALANARPVVRDATHQRVATIPVDAAGPPTAVKGLANVGPQSIAVNISTGEGPTEQEKEAERSRKEKLALKNALPSWMMESTVSGDSFSGSNSSTTIALPKKEEPDTKDSALNSNGEKIDTAQMDDIFARLKAEQAAAASRIDEEEEEEEEEGSDEDEFEDVPATGNTSSGVPSTVGMKREASDEGGSPNNGIGARDSKRVKIESDQENGLPLQEAKPVVVKAEDDEEEEEEEEDQLEFEDV